MSRVQGDMSPAGQSCFIQLYDIDNITIQISLQMHP
jgi:hypothetical protein